MPAEAYRSPRVLALEMAHVFSNAWHFVSHANELARTGDFVVAEHPGGEILACRDGEGVLRVFANLCPVRPHALAAGRGTTAAFECRRHGVIVDLDGTVRSNGGSALGHLTSWRVDETACLVLANADLQALAVDCLVPGLAEELRAHVPELGRLRFKAAVSNDFRANWKVMVDNSVECYHCDTAHPDFTGLLDLASYRIVNHARHASHTARAGSAGNTAYAFDPATDEGFASWWLWPNLLFGPFPGRSNLTVHRILPTGPESAREHFDFYFLPDGPDAAETEAIRFFRDVLRPQDIAICESVQRGLASRSYVDGRLVDDAEGSASSERNIHLFHRLLVETLAKAP